MKFFRIISLILSFALICSFFASGFSVYAGNDDIKQQIEQAQKEKQEIERQLNSAKKQKNDKTAEKNALDKKINNIQKKINLCNQYIANCKAEIAASEAKIADKTAQIEDTKQLLKKRIRSIYNSNTGSSVQILLGAESFSDFLALAELTQCISAQDNALIDAIVSTISEIQKEIEANKQRQAEQDKIKQELAVDKAELDSAVAAVNSLLKDINSDVNSLTKQLQSKNNYIDSLLYGGEIDAPFDGTFIWPVPGYYGISAYWNSNDSVHNGKHHGIDISGGGIANKPIVAAATGTITWLVNSCTHDYSKYSSCGCGSGFGNHVRISHGSVNGASYMTIYGHMSHVANGMYNGRPVSRGQVIGYVGSTGWSTGAHLHFAVARNGGYVNPLRTDLEFRLIQR